MATNTVQIRIIDFYTKAKEISEGKIARDDKGLPIYEEWVAYAPVGAADRLTVRESIRNIKRIHTHGGDDNPAVVAARDIHDFIMPKYEAWSKGNELPTDGTPLTVATFLRKEDVEAIKRAGVQTIEEFASLNDSTRDRINMPRGRDAQMQAKRFLEAKDQNAAAAKIDAQAEELEKLKAQMAELLAARAEEPKRGPGRPRKADAEQEAA